MKQQVARHYEDMLQVCFDLMPEGLLIGCSAPYQLLKDCFQLSMMMSSGFYSFVWPNGMHWQKCACILTTPLFCLIDRFDG
jgi:hypothetical protein